MNGKREELEIRITNWLLGELPPEEAAELSQKVESDLELAKFRDRLKETMALVKEANQTTAQERTRENSPLKLSADRRSKLLQEFRMVRPARWQEQAVSWFRYAPIAVAAVVTLFAGFLILQELSDSKASSASTSMLLTSAQAPQAVAPPFIGLPQSGYEPLKHPNGRADGQSMQVNSRDSLRGDLGTLMVQNGAQALNRMTERASSAITEKSVVLTSRGRPVDRLARDRETLGYDSKAMKQEAEAPPVSAFSGGVGGGALAHAFPSDVSKLAENEQVRVQIRPSASSAEDQAGRLRFMRRYGLQADKGVAEAKEGRPMMEAVAPTVRAPSTEPAPLASNEKLQFGDAATPDSVPASTAVGGVATTARQPNRGSTEPAATFAGALERSGMVPNSTLATPASSASQPTRGRAEAATEDSLQLANRKPALSEELSASASRMKVPTLGDTPKLGAIFRTQTNSVQSAGNYYFSLEPAKKDDANAVLNATITPDASLAPVERFGRELQQEKRKEENVSFFADYDGDSASTQAGDVFVGKKLSTNRSPETVPEVRTADSPFSTFSLNVGDVSYKLAEASLSEGKLPERASIRSEEFINAFNYHDPEPGAGAPVGFVWERARYPFAHNRDLLRLSIKTAAQGRSPSQKLNVTLLLDNSGSMERADRVRIIREALRVLGSKLQPQDLLSVVTFARRANLKIDGLAGSAAPKALEDIAQLTPEGGTNLEEAMRVAYETARRHYQPDGLNRVVLMTDGAANMGEVRPGTLRQMVEAQRKQGIALDCFGIGWEGFNDELLEALARNGDGRYGFINTPEQAAKDFADQLAGALQPAASDVKVQVEFNPSRVSSYRQIGYDKHQLTKEQFRDNTVDAAEIAAAEAGNALYTLEVDPAGNGAIGTVRVRYKVPDTEFYHEHEWAIPYTGPAAPLDRAPAGLRLAATAAGFAEFLSDNPYAAEVTTGKLLGLLGDVPELWSADSRPRQLATMIRQAASITGK